MFCMSIKSFRSSVPAYYALEFATFCRRNPLPCHPPRGPRALMQQSSQDARQCAFEQDGSVYGVWIPSEITDSRSLASTLQEWNRLLWRCSADVGEEKIWFPKLVKKFVNARPGQIECELGKLAHRSRSPQRFTNKIYPYETTK